MQNSAADRAFERAESLRSGSRFAESLAFFRKALAAYSRQRDVPGMLDSHLAIGDVCRMTGMFDAAKESYLHAVNAAVELGDHEAEADALVGMGLAHRGKGNWKEAIRFCTRSARLYRKNGDLHGVAFSLWAVAGAERIRGHIPRAIDNFSRSLELFRELGEDHAAGYCLCGLGGTSRVAGRFSDSLRYYRSANRLFTKLGDRFGTAYSFCGIGNALRMRRRFREALDSFRKASSIYRRIGDRVSYAYTLWSIGTTWKMLGDLTKARSFFQQAEKLFRQTKDPRGLIYCRLGYAETALLEGKAARAEQLVLAGLADARHHGFLVETCHAQALHAVLKGRPSPACYGRLGLKLSFDRIPFNLP